MEKELVTIIIPFYNGEKYIEETVKSCFSQSYKNIEVIVIDDCSKSESFEVLLKLKKIYEGLQIIRNIENKGTIRTSNIGITRAKGTKIILLGQDDILLSKHVEIMIKQFDKNTSFVYCESDYINSEGKIYDSMKLDRSLKNKLYMTNIIHSCGLMFSKEKAIEVGLFEYNKIYPNFGEWLLWIKLSLVGEIKFCDLIKSRYRRHENNMTNLFVKKDVKKLLRKYFFKCMKYSKDNVYKEFTLKEKIMYNIYFVKKYLKI